MRSRNLLTILAPRLGRRRPFAKITEEENLAVQIAGKCGIESVRRINRLIDIRQQIGTGRVSKMPSQGSVESKWNCSSVERIPLADDYDMGGLFRVPSHRRVLLRAEIEALGSPVLRSVGLRPHHR